MRVNVTFLKLTLNDATHGSHGVQHLAVPETKSA
jgi:hypothetical protein